MKTAILGFAQAVKNHGDEWRMNMLAGYIRILGYGDHPQHRAVIMSDQTVTSDQHDFHVMRDWMPGGFNRRNFSRG